jgi:ribonuclease HII
MPSADSSALFSKQPEFDPTLYESELRQKGYRWVAGTDEVGRGALAGPVVAAVVILPYPHSIEGIKDSKLLTPPQREKLFGEISQKAVAWAVGRIEADEIDRINIFQASLKAMVQAVQKLSISPEILLVDGSHRVPLFIPQKAIVKGDRYCLSIGAASILAKVTRDRLMKDLELEYPHYRFSVHKGYPTKQHRDEIRQHGISSLHRKSFRLNPLQ